MQAGAKWVGVATGVVVIGAVAVTAVVMTGAGLPESVAQGLSPSPGQGPASSSSQTSVQPASVQMAQASTKASRAGAADRTTVTMQYGGWKVTCDEGGEQTVCSAAFRILDQNTKQTILTWLLGRSSDGRLLTEFFVPTEVMIGPGVSVSLEDGPAYTADFVACGKSACKAVLPLDPALVTELASATKATLSLTGTNGKVTRFTMGIEGIDAALAELSSS
jgi:invasion protein IalB